MRSLSTPLKASLLTALLTLPIPCFAQGMQALADYLYDFIANQIFIVMGGVVVVFIFYYGARMIMESQNDNALTDARKSFLNAVIGFALLAATFPIMNAFITGNENLPINTAILLPEFNNIIQYVTFAARGVFVLLLTYHGLRIMAAQGDEGEVEAARKGIITNILGIILTAIADAIVSSIYGNAPVDIAVEMAGLASFVIVLIGGFSVLALIIAGIMLIVSVDEGLQDKAKKIVTGTIISIIICLASYAIIGTFAFA